MNIKSSGAILVGEQILDKQSQQVVACSLDKLELLGRYSVIYELSRIDLILKRLSDDEALAA